MPDQKYLQDTFDYDPDTGLFKRKGRKYNEQCAALYRTVRIAKKKYYVHRLIWIYMTGDDPGNMEIDHINRDRHDNRWSNLRLTTRSENAFNTGNTCIRIRPRKKAFQARLTRKGRTVCKSFAAYSEAEDFVKQMKQEMM